MARMPKGQRVLVSVLMLPETKAELERACREEGRTLSDMGQRFIEAGLAARARRERAPEAKARELMDA